MKNHTHRCHDLYIASLLIASKKLNLNRLEKSGKHIVFIFDDPVSHAQSIIQSYVRREFMVNGLDFVEAIKLLKNRVYLGM